MAWCLLGLVGPAAAHSGGLDQGGGHHCRQRGYDSGSCAPLNSYHCHRSYCTEPGSGGGSSTRREPAAPADTDAPDAPVLYEPRAEGSRVSLDVLAERGSRVVVESDGVVRHRATASGERQELSFSLPDGAHRLDVTATDSAGNQSEVATTEVDVDTVPPSAPALSVTPAEPGKPDTRVEVRGERNSVVALQAATPDGTEVGAPLSRPLGTTGAVTLDVRLPNGSHVLTATLSDEAGNVSEQTVVPAEVAIAPPASPRLSVGSDRGATPVLLVVRGDPHTTATVTTTVRGEPLSRETELGSDGRGEVEFPLDDGSYEAVATLIDFQGQPSEPSRDVRVVVKSTPPILELVTIDDLLASGKLAFALRAEEGARVRVSAEGADIEREFRATGAVETLILPAVAGLYDVRFEVEDTYGNVTRLQRSAEVDTPFGAGEAAVLAGLLGGVVWGGRRGWRRWRARKPKQV